MSYEFVQQLPMVPYGSTGTNARYDADTDSYYNEFGQELRNPEEYDCEGEIGYTPFGDE
jgi:hypothetical protein